MEADSKNLGLEGVLFRYYACSGCGKDSIFVDVHPLEGESTDEFRVRKEELESAIDRLRARQADVTLVERHAGFSVWA